MTAYVLKHNMQTGIPSVEMFLTGDHLTRANAQHAGQVIKAKADLQAAKERYKGQSWVETLLSTIDAKKLEDA